MLLFDRSDRLRVLFSGPNAAPTIDGLVTNDVKLLAPGQGCYAAILTAKGKIVADVRILRRDDDILVDVAPRAASGAWDVFKKYVNPRFAKYEDATTTLAMFTLVGPHDRVIPFVSQLVGVSADQVMALPSFHHLSGTFEETPITLVRTPELGDLETGVCAIDIIGPRTLWNPLSSMIFQLGATASTAAAWDALRIRAGRPAWGIEMDETTLPQEANFDELGGVSYTKGCYIGQEPVARIHFRGHVNKSLRVLTLQSATPPLPGAELFGEDERSIGDLRSVTPLDTPNTYQGIGMVRREIANGVTLTARWDSNPSGELAQVTVLRQAAPGQTVS